MLQNNAKQTKWWQEDSQLAGERTEKSRVDAATY